MYATNWSSPTDTDTVYRRASGRRHYNAVRAFRAEARRSKLVGLLRALGGLTVRGTQARAARELGVSSATITRDVHELLRRWRAARYDEPTCPCI
jgi:hypothetical protein